MEAWDLESIKTVAIFVTSFVACTNLFIVLVGKISSKPKLELIIESAKLIEDYPGEVGTQIDISFRAYNGIFFLKEIDLANSSGKVDRGTKKTIDIYEYLSRDIIKEYMETQKNTTSSEIKKGERLDQFKYYTDLDSGKIEIRRDKTTRNHISPNVDSCFQRALDHLCEKAVREGDIYRKISYKMESLRDLKIDENVSFSFTVFAHIYGELNQERYERKYVPLDGWSLIVKYGKGNIRKKIKPVKISYSELSDFIDSKQNLGSK